MYEELSEKSELGTLLIHLNTSNMVEIQAIPHTPSPGSTEKALSFQKPPFPDNQAPPTFDDDETINKTCAQLFLHMELKYFEKANKKKRASSSDKMFQISDNLEIREYKEVKKKLEQVDFAITFNPNNDTFSITSIPRT